MGNGFIINVLVSFAERRIIEMEKKYIKQMQKFSGEGSLTTWKKKTSILCRILDKVGVPDILERLSVLSNSELNSLLLVVHRQTTEQMTPAELLRKYQENRFTKPCNCDPASMYRLAAALCELAKEQNICPVLLSPVAPLGSCSVFGCVNQNKVLSGVRNCETMADVSNILAIIIADQINVGHKVEDELHFCALHSVVRAQKFSKAGNYSHFHLFCMVSAGRDRGSYRSEMQLMGKQLDFLHRIFRQIPETSLSMVIQKRGGYKDGDGFLSRMLEYIHTIQPDLSVTITKDDTDNLYYRGLNYKLYLHTVNGSFEVGDGGFVDWIERMTGNQKIRCLICGIGMERLIGLTKW